MKWEIFTKPQTVIGFVLVAAMIVGLIIFLVQKGIMFKSEKFSISSDNNARLRVNRQMMYVHEVTKNYQPTFDMLIDKWGFDGHLKKSIIDSLLLRVELQISNWVVQNHIGNSDTEIEAYCKRKVDLLIGNISKYLYQELPDYDKSSWDDLLPKLGYRTVQDFAYTELLKIIKNAKAEAVDIK